METEVNPNIEPFADAWLDALDKMPKDEALTWVQSHIDQSIKSRSSYGDKMLTCTDAELAGVINAWCIDSNNVIKFTKLYRDIERE